MIRECLYSIWATRVRVFATISMVFVMAGHGLFGCCWHHACASEAGSEECQAIVSHSECYHRSCEAIRHTEFSHQHEDGGEAVPGHDESAPCPNHGLCDEADCVFVRTDGDQNLNSSHRSSLETMGVSDPSPLVSFARGNNIPAWSRYHCGKPALRPHLLLQILLI
jgi:hypothetical protein